MLFCATPRQICDVLPAQRLRMICVAIFLDHTFLQSAEVGADAAIHIHVARVNSNGPEVSREDMILTRLRATV